MKFPSKILPKPNRKYINCDLSQFILIRHTDTAEVNEILDPQTGFVKEMHICHPSEQASDLSTSLFGVFKLKHLFIQLTKDGKRKYNEYCSPSIRVKKPVSKKDFEINYNRHYWIIKIGDINNTVVVYQRSNLDFQAMCVVEHTPMLWNFWHFSIRWKTDQGFWHQLTDPQKRTLSRRLKHEARAHIKMFAKLEVPGGPQLERKCFERRKKWLLNVSLIAVAIYVLKKAFSKRKQ